MNKQQLQKENPKNEASFLLFCGVLLIAINLRPAITSVGPLMGTIRDHVGLENWSVALLTSLPLIAFAMMSPFAPKLGNRLTNEWALATGLLLLMTGIGLRSISVVFFLFLGTFLAGFGIAICNVLLPSVIKEKFPAKVAVMTSLYTTGMAIFATTASGVSIPLADGLGIGWQLALLLWMIPAILALLIWFVIAKKHRIAREVDMPNMTKQSSKGIWQSRQAWQVAMFMGLQSLIFYVTISWLAEIVIDFGMTKLEAGFMVSYVQLLGIPVSFVMPMLAIKLASQSKLILGVNTLYITGLCLLLMQPTYTGIFIAVGLIGIASSSNFALALTFLSIRAKNAKDAAALSGMAQSMGYILAAIGPIIIGYMYDVTKGWTVPLFFLMGITLAIIFFGMRAGQNKYVLE